MAKTKLPDDVLEFFAKHGSKGGKIGGKKRMAALTPEERSALGKKGAAKSVAARAKKKAASNRTNPRKG